jgi:hypothetical protein
VSTLVVPSMADGVEWPSLGGAVVKWLNTNAVYGPGEKAGEPYVVEPEFEAQLWRMYEVYPKDHPSAGRRRYKRAALSLRKGTAKTEKAMLIAFAELHPEAPVRTVGWVDEDTPEGWGVAFPYIPLVATTLEQTEDLGFDVLRYIIGESPLADWYDIGLERIAVLDDRGRAAGKVVPLAGSPSARDGARTTFQHFDETHRMIRPALRKAHTTMGENIYKRVGADPWSLETTTQPAPGEGSIAEDTHQYAEAVARGEVDDPRLFYFHRQAPDDAPLNTPEEVRAALIEASGPAAEWSGDIDGLVSRYFDPTTDRSYWRRVWLNQCLPDSDLAFDPKKWASLADPRGDIPKRTLITLGFDGSRWDDHSGLVATTVEDGHQLVLGHWVPDPASSLGITDADVEAAVHEAFTRFRVWRAYFDPFRWEDMLDRLIGRYGAERIKPWHTNRPRQMSSALRVYRDAMMRGDLSNDGHEGMAKHVGNARRRYEDFDEEAPTKRSTSEPTGGATKGQRAWTIRKERPNSEHKIDLAMAGCLSWEARSDAIASGAKPNRSTFASY